MGSFTPSGVEFVARNLNSYLGDLAKADKAQQNLGKSASSIGGHFANAKSGVASFSQAVGSSSSTLGSFVSKLGNVATVAGGIITADIFRNIAGGVTDLVSTALGEFARYERMALSVQSLVARELAQGEQVEVQRQVLAGLTKKEADELGGLAGKIHTEELQRNALKTTIKEQSEALRQLREKEGDSSLNVQDHAAKLAILEDRYNTSGQEIDNMKNRMTELSGKEGQLVTVMEKVRTGQMDMNTAMQQAGPRAAELLSWISKLAVMSPFSEQGIQDAFQTALAYGFTTEAAQRLTEAEVDFTAATGKNIEQANLIALALGQMQAKGKVSGQELIQLTNAGIGVNSILEGMGFSLDDVSNGLVSADSFIEAVIKDMEVFKGAGAAQATTFSGLISTLSDLKAIGLREFFTGTFTAIQPYLADFVGMLTSAALETGSIREIGDVFGQYVGAGLQKAAGLANTFYESIQKVMGAFSRFGVRGATVSILGQLGLDPTQIAGVMGVVDQVAGAIDKITGAFQRFGLKGATVSIMGMLGLDPTTIGTIFTTIDQVTTAITTFVGKVSQAYSKFGVKGATVSILGQLGMDPETIGVIFTTIQQVTDFITSSLDTISQVYAQFGAQGAAISILSILGFSSETIGTITVAVQSIITTVQGLVTWWITNWPVMQATAMTAWVVIQGIFAGFQNVAALLSANLGQAFGNINQALSNLGLTWGDVWDSIKTATGIVLAGIGALLVGAIAAISGLVVATTSAISTMTSVWQALMGQITTIITGITQSLVGVGQVWTGIITGDWATIWQGLVLMVIGAVNQIKGLIGTLVTLFTGPFAIILETVKGFVQGVVAVFSGLYNTLVGHSIIPDLINDTVAWFKKLPNLILNTLSTLASRITEPFENTWEAIKEAINIDEWSTLGTNAIEGLLEGMKEKAGEVLEFLKSLAMDSLTGLGQFWGAESPAKKFMPLGASVPQGLAIGINNASSVATQAIQNMGRNLLTSTSNSLRFIDDLDMGGFKEMFGTGGGQWRNFRNILKHEITAGMGALADGTANVMDSVMQVAARFKFPPQMAAEFAKANGLVEHLTSSMTAFKKQINIENLGNLTQMAGSFSSLGSTFADMLTTQMGSSDEANKTVEAYQKLTAEAGTQSSQLAILQQELIKLTTSEGSNQIAIDKKRLAIEKATESLGFGERQLEIYRQELAILMQDETGNALQIEKKTLQIDRQVEAIDAQNKQLVTLQQELEKLTATNELDTASIEKKRLEIEKLTGEMAKNQEAVLKGRKDFEALVTGPLADRIAFLDAFLESGQESIRIIGEELGGIFAGTGQTADVFWDRVSAQDELNRLLEEQARQEELITAQKEAQQKLDFLKSQLDLIKLGQGLGGNIFQGMKFGLDASVEDLLAATNNIVMAMVDQINNDLQLGSPSRLMIKTFENVMAGAAIGVDKGSRALEYAFSASVSPFLNMGQRTASPLASTYNNSTTNNFDMKVYTGANPAAVIRQYEVARSMV